MNLFCRKNSKLIYLKKMISKADILLEKRNKNSNYNNYIIKLIKWMIKEII